MTKLGEFLTVYLHIDSYNNWVKAVKDKNPEGFSAILEYPLFTDVSVVIGSVSKPDDCPYEILNTLVLDKENIFLPRMVLRIYQYLVPLDNMDRWSFYISKTDFDLKKIENFNENSIIFFRKELDRANEYKVGIKIGNKWVKESFIYTTNLEDINYDEQTGLVKKNNEIDKIISHIVHGQKLEEYYRDINMPQQIAVLLSLIYGVRIKAGDLNRRIENGQSIGEPVNHNILKNPRPEKFVGRNPILPTAIKELNLSMSLYAFYKFPNLSSERALATLRAAKLYSDALVVIESDVSLAWLWLVSAIEVAAEQWREDKKIDGELKNLGEKFPNIIDLLLKYFKPSSSINEKRGVEIKFCAFILSYLPEEPSERPIGAFSIGWDGASVVQKESGDWSEENILKILKGIYNHRSRALHGGIPFPQRMCGAPLKLSNVPFSERSAESVPDSEAVLVCTFEYIVRKSLLNWLKAED